jgi:hypothetical protein
MVCSRPGKLVEATRWNDPTEFSYAVSWLSMRGICVARTSEARKGIWPSRDVGRWAASRAAPPSVTKPSSINELVPAGVPYGKKFSPHQYGSATSPGW